eukprot:234814_1
MSNTHLNAQHITQKTTHLHVFIYWKFQIFQFEKCMDHLKMPIMKTILCKISTSDLIQMLRILNNMINCTYFRYTLNKFSVSKSFLMPLLILLVFQYMKTIKIGIQYKKLTEYDRSLPDIEAEIVFIDYINSYLSNVSFVLLIFTVKKSFILCIIICFLIIFRHLVVHYMLQNHLYENELCFIQYNVLNYL